MSRYFFSFFIAFGIYVIFYMGIFYFLKNNKIILDKPTVNQNISLNHIEMKAMEKKIVEDKIVENSIQEEIKEKIEETPKEENVEKTEVKEALEEVIKEEKIAEIAKPEIKKELKKETKEKVIKKVQKKEIVEKKQITKKETKEIKDSENPKKESIVKEQTAQKHIQSEEIVKTQINDTPKIDDKKVYLDKHLIQIRNLINQNIKYPVRARKLSIQGVVLVKFKITQNGDIENITILDGHKFLQNATIEAINEASKSFPKTNQTIEIQIPIEYKLI
ncbi:energy transducer TonB [Arcobacter sp. s6]|uniref:energy transducer TonB n=1 Tax=Arcobacter sp. s6 TaxID=3230363 RepID=UPI0034A04A9A